MMDERFINATLLQLDELLTSNDTEVHDRAAKWQDDNFDMDIGFAIMGDLVEAFPKFSELFVSRTIMLYHSNDAFEIMSMAAALIATALYCRSIQPFMDELENE